MEPIFWNNRHKQLKEALQSAADSLPMPERHGKRVTYEEIKKLLASLSEVKREAGRIYEDTLLSIVMDEDYEEEGW